MIVKMKFLNIMGPKDDIDRVVEKYLSKYEFHLENSMQELDKVRGLKTFTEANPYSEILSRAQDLARISGVDISSTGEDIDRDEAFTIISEVEDSMHKYTSGKNTLLEELHSINELKAQIMPFRKLDFDIQTLLNFEFIKYRFGRMPRENYRQFEEYIHSNTDVLFVTSAVDANYVWGIYFVPDSLKEKADAIFSSLHFERIIISGELNGTPLNAFNELDNNSKIIQEKLDNIEKQQSEQIESKNKNIANAYHKIKNLYDYFDIRKYAAYTKDNFYIITGWMTADDAKHFEKDIKGDENVVCVIENEHSTLKPPTKLKNFFLFKPFELFVQMYGLPSYKELDPTAFVAITYAFLFGMMFGDVGQGAIFVIGGFILYKTKKMALAAIISLAGIFSVIFGFMYGTVFGYEELIPTLWLKPMAEINTALIVSVVFGVGLIILAMIFNIINAFKDGDMGRALFDTSGISGLVFYSAVILTVIMYVTGNFVVANWILGIFIGFPLLLVAAKDPLTKLMMGSKKILPDNKVLYVLEHIFELFEILLSYITNSISFVRVGAFALSHAGMMHVVHMLAKMSSDNPNFLIFIGGNILVMVLEGLIVGIQVLRLEYYEMFSRFFKGGGKPFVSYLNNK